jgi:hypothetical protein
MLYQLYKDYIIVLAIIIIIGGILYTRKHYNSIGARITPYREPLVPEEFYKLCMPAEQPRIIWIIRNYQADTAVHDINTYMVEKLGWDVIVIVADKTGSDTDVLEFHQKTEIENAISGAHCIIGGAHVIETAFITAERAKRPFIVFADSCAVGSPVLKDKAYNLLTNASFVRCYEQSKVPTFILNTPLDLKKYRTHTSRRYITMITTTENAREFFKIAAALPEYEFMYIGNKYQEAQSSNVAVWKTPQDIRKAFRETGILCVFSEDERRAIQSMATGIPIVASKCEGLGQSVIVAHTTEEWIDAIRKLKTEPLYYKKYSDLILKRYDAWDYSQLEKFKAWIEGPVSNPIDPSPSSS